MEPLVNSFALITKYYTGVLNENLKELPVNRYYNIILEIGEHKGNMNLKELADLFQVDKVIITRNIHYLEKKSIVRKRDNESDHRSYKVELTDLGRIYYKRIKEAYSVTDGICLEKFSAMNRESFIRNLNTIKKTLQYTRRKKTNLTLKSAGKS